MTVLVALSRESVKESGLSRIYGIIDHVCSVMSISLSAIEWRTIREFCAISRSRNALSPYLFVLCMEVLGLLIKQEVEKGKWKPLKKSFVKWLGNISLIFYG